MAEYTVTVNDTEVETLTVLAKKKWREPPQQLSAMIEEDLQAYRAKSDGLAITRTRRPRTTRNGTTALVAGSV